MKNAFYFTLKALLVIKIFKFCLEFSVMSENSLIRKMRLISKFMTSQPINKQLQYILTNISRSKGNQALKFCQLIEHNMRNPFSEK